MRLSERVALAPLWWRYGHLYRKHRVDTTVSRRRFVDTLAICRHLQGVEGVLVECGCWRGGMIAAITETLPDRRVYMLDSFEGFPDPGDKDPGRAEWMAEHGRLAVASDVARAAMMRAGANDFEILEGWFDDTVPALAATRPRIAMLRLDGNLYDSTMVCLEHLGPLVVPGGAIIVNVYGDWEGTTRAMHDWLSRCGRVEPIQRTRRACVAHVIVRP